MPEFTRLSKCAELQVIAIPNSPTVHQLMAVPTQRNDVDRLIRATPVKLDDVVAMLRAITTDSTTPPVRYSAVLKFSPRMATLESILRILSQEIDLRLTFPPANPEPR